MINAIAFAGALTWREGDEVVAARPGIFGDVVLARKEMPASYHLAVTVDDHLQGITLVTRGEDLYDATHVHRLLQALLGLDTPDYRHHPHAHRRRRPAPRQARPADVLEGAHREGPDARRGAAHGQVRMTGPLSRRQACSPLTRST